MRTSRSLYPIMMTVTVVTLTVACESSTPFELADLVGIHILSTVSGEPLPFIRRQSGADPSCIQAGVAGDLVERINNGSLGMQEDHSFELTFTILGICTYPSGMSTTSSSLRTTGSFSITDEAVDLNPAGTGWVPMTGVRARDGIVISTRIPGDHAARSYSFRPLR